ncbi:hypothetical protein Sarmat_00748 [Rickettsiales endosymbiont of Paramecium tredecaurelia]|nr:hypothetical protein [Candidatus Sarmatiella mevalonica]
MGEQIRLSQNSLLHMKALQTRAACTTAQSSVVPALNNKEAPATNHRLRLAQSSCAQPHDHYKCLRINDGADDIRPFPYFLPDLLSLGHDETDVDFSLILKFSF